jgi:hypothetical protein
LARHDDAGLSCFTDIRIGNSLAEAEVHGLYSFFVEKGSRAKTTIMITVINYDNNTPRLSLCQEREACAGVVWESGMTKMLKK